MVKVVNNPTRRAVKFTARINVAMTPEQRAWLDKYCKKRGVTVSEFVREAVRRQQQI